MQRVLRWALASSPYFEGWLVETDFYSITYDSKNHIEWTDFSVLGYQGEGNPFDVLKVRVLTSVLGGG